MASAYSRDEEGTALVSANVASQVPKSHWRDVHILCSSYFLSCLAYGASQNFLTTVNSKDDLGTKSLGILYMSFTFFSLVASSVVRWLGPNFFFILRRTSHELIVAGNLESTVYTMHPASLYLGFAFSIIWIGQGTYLTSVAHNHARDHTFHEGSVIGEFNGEFRGMYAVLHLCYETEWMETRVYYGKLLSALSSPFGISGVGGAMAVHGIFDGICSPAALSFSLSKWPLHPNCHIHVQKRSAKAKIAEKSPMFLGFSGTKYIRVEFFPLITLQY